MGRITKPQKVQKTTIFNDLTSNIVKGKVVLILGHEHILNSDMSDGNLLSEMTATFFEYKKEKDCNFKSTYNSFNDYYYEGGADLAKMKKEIVESISKSHYDFAEADYSPLIIKLLEKKRIRVVLTTTYDYYAETIMRRIWGDELRVLNIYGKDNDFLKEELWRPDVQPTLYYVFGKAERGKDFAVVERDSMIVIHKWMGKTAPENFCSFLKDKSILALGTKFDDWLFRFFWYAMHRDITRLNDGQVAISLQEDNETEARLSSFLKKEGIANSSIEEVIKRILNEIEERENALLPRNEKNADIFISYSSASYDSVRHLYYSLLEEGFNVWFDKSDLKFGERHEQSILNTISKCKIFIPVLTKPVKDILSKDLSETKAYFRDVEWKAAQSRYSMRDNGFHVVPICMDGLTMKDIWVHESQKKLMEFIQSTSVGDNTTEVNYRRFIENLKELVK